jgi:hypothetical protein
VEEKRGKVRKRADVPLHCVHCLTVVSVDLISTSTARDIGPGLAAMMYLTGNRRSQAGRQLYQFEMGGWEGVCVRATLLT